MNLSIGTSGFAYREWKGPFYPKDLPPARMLQFYAERFNSVEINSTFYSMPKPSMVAAWAREAPGQFKFAIKIPQSITHRKQPVNPEGTIQLLLDAVALLKEQLGPFLFQLPPWMKKDAVRLREFLALLPVKHPITFEFRHESWFEQEIHDLLSERNAALCIADDANDLKIPLVATANWGYLRLRRLDYGDMDLKSWADKIGKQKWKSAFVYFRHEDTAKGPVFAAKFGKFANACRGKERA